MCPIFQLLKILVFFVIFIAGRNAFAASQYRRVRSNCRTPNAIINVRAIRSNCAADILRSIYSKLELNVRSSGFPIHSSCSFLFNVECVCLYCPLEFIPQIGALSLKSDLPKVRIAFLLTLNGRAVRQVHRLLKLLYGEEHFYYIHVDSVSKFGL